MTDDQPQDVEDFFPDDQDNRLYGVDIPSNQPEPYGDRIPSGYDPMGEIELRGRAYRGLASGQIPLWVLISAWVLFGIPLLLLMILGVISGELSLLPALIICGLPGWILWRGTWAHISRKKRKKRQRR